MSASKPKSISEVAAQINPLSILGFIDDLRGLANDLEHMKETTPFANQAIGTAKLLKKYGIE